MITSYKTRFSTLQDGFLVAKSKNYATWTIPYLMAEPNKDGMQVAIEGDYQSSGALLVNSLSSKLSGLLFPTTHPFMDLNVTRDGMAALAEALEEQGSSDTPQSVLAVLVSEACSKAFTGKSFFQLVLAFKHLIVTGNVAVHRVADEDAIVCHGLQNYVTRRDGIGRVVEAIIKEELYFGTLPEDVQEYVRTKGNFGEDTPQLRDRVITKYTRLVREGKYIIETHGIDDVILTSEFETRHEAHLCPYFFPTWTLLNGEHYGRGLVEELKGDFAKLSELSESLLEYEIEAMRVVYLVQANSYDAIDDLAEADTGDYVRASNGTITAFETGASNKIEFILNDLEAVFTRLARAMMWRGNTREGERVTAYEIRQEIQEVEASMGGAYSALAETFQLPLVYLYLFEVDYEFMTTLMDLEVGKVQVTTGINALGKTTKANKILEVLQEAGAAIEMAQFDRRIDPTKIMDLFFESKGLDFKEISKTDEQLEQEAQAAMEAEQAQAQMQEGAMMGQLGNAIGDTQGGM